MFCGAIHSFDGIHFFMNLQKFYANKNDNIWFSSNLPAIRIFSGFKYFKIFPCFY